MNIFLEDPGTGTSPEIRISSTTTEERMLIRLFYEQVTVHNKTLQLFEAGLRGFNEQGFKIGFKEKEYDLTDAQDGGDAEMPPDIAAAAEELQNAIEEKRARLTPGYKVGDVVQLKTLDELREEYPENPELIFKGLSINSDMEALLGGSGQIEEVAEASEYWLSIGYYWPLEAIKGLAD